MAICINEYFFLASLGLWARVDQTGPYLENDLIVPRPDVNFESPFAVYKITYTYLY